MKKKYTWRIVIAALAIMAALTMIFVTIAIMLPPKQTTRAVKYDLDCVAGRSRNPLKDCKQSKKYALECGPQYVKLPKEKCEIKEQQ